MKISYVTSGDAADVHHWSGLTYYIAQALGSESDEVEYLDKMSPQLNLLTRLKIQYYKRIGRGFDFNRDISVAKRLAKRIEPLISPDSNIIFSPSSLQISLIKAKQPKVFYTDATFAGLIDFYDDFRSLSAETIKNGNYIEQAALDSSALAIYSSDWAAQTAIDNYKVDPAKIHIVPFGANIKCDRDLNGIERIVQNRSEQECHLLFIGVDWTRKGGDLALKIADELKQQGVNVILHLVGIKNLPVKDLPGYVIDHGYISKRSNDGVERMNKLMAESHFLILPSKADCTPVVYSEANSFGLPCITTNVGGIPSIIKDDINGKTFSLSDMEQDYSQYIQAVFSDKVRYKQLALSSFNEYESRLNWGVAGKHIMRLLREL